LFKSYFKTDNYGLKFPLILHFTKQFKLPWILRWQYVIVGDFVEGHWYVKWWDKFDFNPIVQKVKLMIQAPKAQNLPLPSIISPKLLTPNDVSQPQIDAAPSNVSLAGSSSSKKQSSKEKKKKALMKAMALLDSLSGSDGDDDEDDGSEASSDIPDPQRNLFGNSGFNTQDYVPGLEDL
jgi:hypothetical protein